MAWSVWSSRHCWPRSDRAVIASYDEHVARSVWSTGSSPFLTERARARAPQILSYAAVTGGALLLAPNGKVVLFSGAAGEADLERIARIAAALGAADKVVAFKEHNVCVHAAPVCMGWTLCVLSTVGAFPGDVVERLRRASAVMALALVDGVPSGGGTGGAGPEGAPAEVMARARNPRPS